MFLPLRNDTGNHVRQPLSRRIASRWPFLFEADALSHPQIDTTFADLIRAFNAQAVIVDYVPSASYVRSIYSAPIGRVTITLNREADRYRELSRTGKLPPDAPPAWIAAARANRFEKWIYRHSDAVIALGDGDLPSWRGRPHRREVMPPVFDASPFRWQYTGMRTVFFVGNVAHYPNLQAIEWLATKLAPELEAIDSGIEIRILGASAGMVPADWRRPNVLFLGAGEDEVPTGEFVIAGLFVAPIANAYGSKIKLLDCLAHETPFVATAEALTGLPFVSGVPQIKLEQPRAAGELISDLLSRRETLELLSERLSSERDAFLAQRDGRWGRLLRSVVETSR